MADRRYLRDIKPDTTWKQFSKKHPNAGITEEDFKKLIPPPGFEWHKGPKYKKTYGGWERTEREVKMGGIIRSTSADRDAEGEYLHRNDGGIARKTRIF
jgi:hypothetical protein